MILSFAVEKSNTPIYQRIMEALTTTLTSFGHKVNYVNNEKVTLDQYVNSINQINPDFILVTNHEGIISQYHQDLGKFTFQIIDQPIIFIHHDSLLCYYAPNIDFFKKYLLAWSSISKKSWHFCLEYENFLDLRSLGIENCFPIVHGSEFIKLPKINSSYTYDVSFVGHVLPNLDCRPKNILFPYLLQANIWYRLADLNHRVIPCTEDIANEQLKGASNLFDFLSLKYFYVSLLHLQSLYFRGEIISSIEDDIHIDIIGGDPGYMKDIADEHFLTIKKENVKYHKPTLNTSRIDNVYSNSKINLNITSLQFDDAVINRVIDVAAIGGFILTDSRTDLAKTTSVHREISYNSTEELNEKIAYYLHSDHEKERLDIAETLHQEVMATHNYEYVVQDMLDKINLTMTSETNNSELKIDLGCGNWKPEGFVGVDISLQNSSADIAADLNRRFPFPDNSADVIRAHDVIEHLTDRIHTMNELWRVSKADGLIDIRVPSTDGRGAFQDPTHVSFWNINSFMYYCIEHPDYLKLNQTYGFKGAFRIERIEHEYSEGDVVHVCALLRTVKQNNEEKYSNYISQLKSINILICPDWQENEESLYKNLRSCFLTIFNHPRQKDISILIGITEHTSENVDSFLSDIALDLIFEENIDVSDGEPNIIFISMENHELLRCLEPRISKLVDLVNVDPNDLSKLLLDLGV